MLLVNFVHDEIRSVRNELAEWLASQTELTALSIAEPAVVGDYAQIEQILKLRAKYPRVTRITWTDNQGTRIEAQGVIPSHAPEFF